MTPGLLRGKRRSKSPPSSGFATIERFIRYDDTDRIDRSIGRIHRSQAVSAPVRYRQIPRPKPTEFTHRYPSYPSSDTLRIHRPIPSVSIVRYASYPSSDIHRIHRAITTAFGPPIAIDLLDYPHRVARNRSSRGRYITQPVRPASFTSTKSHRSNRAFISLESARSHSHSKISGNRTCFELATSDGVGVPT